MKVIYLTKQSSDGGKFEITEVPEISPKKGEVKIKVDYFGLNYADVMATKGLYNDCPPLPAVLGYECVGKIIDCGEGVSTGLINKRVLAFTRFGSYAEYVCADSMGVVVLPENITSENALALAVQYATAWYASVEMVNLQKDDVVLIHAAGGGVGTGLVQICKWKNCTVIALAGSDDKKEYILNNGADHFINYKKENYQDRIKQNFPGGIDVSFNAVAGDTIKKDRSLLATGGRLIMFGVSQRSGSRKGILPTLKLLLQVGFISPLFLMVKSQGLIGFNMLRVGENKPLVLKRCLENSVSLAEKGIFKPVTTKIFPVENISDAHAYLASGKSTGKIGVKW